MPGSSASRTVDAARAAVETVIDHSDRWPPWADVLREYRSAARRNAEVRADERGLEEPAPDPANAARARELLERIGRRIDPPRVHTDHAIPDRAEELAGERARAEADREHGAARSVRQDTTPLHDVPDDEEEAP